MLMILGRLLGCYAILLQIAVFLQPLLPEQYQISPVCETVAQAFKFDQSVHSNHHVTDVSSHQHDEKHSSHFHHIEQSNNLIDQIKPSNHHHHDPGHQCQYCVVYSHVLPLPDIDLTQVLVRIQVRFLAFIENYFHVFFDLQQLFLIPQGRAPPLLPSL
ncbi:DUF2946 domain-containing protein [Acinetobacter beijerinckii]|uniref:DUF2946 domain-containing protein n=1 Tax=Acinetobacter beijerinckii TaxID=262668 RepID=UPI0030099A4D